MLVSFGQVSGSCSKGPVIFKPYNFDPTPRKLILKLKPEVLKLDLRALWAATVVLQESYKIAPLPAVHLG